MIVDYVYGVMYARFFMFCIVDSILNIIALFVLLKINIKSMGIF